MPAQRQTQARRRRQSQRVGNLHPWRPQRRPASMRSSSPCAWSSAGAGELLVTSMDRDGTKSGFDLELTRAIADAVHVPVVASGGVGSLDDLVDGRQAGPCQRRARRLDLPLRHLHDRRGQGAISADGIGIPHDGWTEMTFSLDQLERPRRRPRRGLARRKLHGQAARATASSAAREKFGEEAVEAVIAAVVARQDRAHRRGRRRALSPAGAAQGGRRVARRRDGRARAPHRRSRASRKRHRADS